jgi:uncharacterized membrane protein YciS (DUF1049 family)
MQWTNLYNVTNLPIAIYCRAVMINASMVFVSSCTDSSGENILQLLWFNPSLDYITFLPYTVTNIYDYKFTTGHSLSYTGNSIVMFGGELQSNVNNDLVQIIDGAVNLTPESSFFSSGLEKRSFHTAVSFGERIIIFGGVGSLSSRTFRLYSILFSNMYEFRRMSTCPVVNNTVVASSDCVLCSTGTYHFASACTACPVGTYQDKFGQTKCTSCPAGFFGIIVGASESNLCIPCPQGSYNPTPGASSCISCTLQQNCPVGATIPVTTGSGNQTVTPLSTYTVVQPSPQPNTATPYSMLVAIVLPVAAGVIIVTIITILFMWKIGLLDTEAVENLDLIYNSWHNYKVGYMEKKLTAVGAMFTIIVIGVVTATLTLVFYGYAANNMNQDRSLLPSAVIDSTVISGMSASLSILNYHGLCVINSSSTTCAPRITKAIKNIVPNAKESLLCHVQQDAQNLTNCNLQYSCSNCTIGDGESSLSFYMLSDNSYATGYAYDLQFIAGVISTTNQPTISRTSGSLYATSGTVYRGTTTSTHVIVQAVPTSFYDTTAQILRTGYHTDFIDTTQGDTVDWTSFNNKNGIVFTFTIRKVANTLMVTNTQKMAWNMMLSQAVSVGIGLIYLVGVAMNVFEMIHTSISNKIEMTKIKKRLERRDAEIIEDNIELQSPIDE